MTGKPDRKVLVKSNAKIRRCTGYNRSLPHPFRYDEGNIPVNECGIYFMIDLFSTGIHGPGAFLFYSIGNFLFGKYMGVRTL